MVPNRTQNTQQWRSQLPTGGQREGHEGVFQQARPFSVQQTWLPFDLLFTELELPSRGVYGTSRVRSSANFACKGFSEGRIAPVRYLEGSPDRSSTPDSTSHK